MNNALEPLPSAPENPSVVLIEDQTLMRLALQQMLSQEKKWTDIESFSDARIGLERCLQKPPDLVIIDADLSTLNGWEIISEIKNQTSQTRILMLASGTFIRSPIQCIQAGVSGFVDKTTSSQTFLQAVNAVMAGALFFTAYSEQPRGISDGLDAPGDSESPIPFAPDPREPNPRDILTKEELTIARLVVAGLSSKEIATELDLTARSVDKHRANIMEKMGVRQTAGLVRLCVLNGIA